MFDCCVEDLAEKCEIKKKIPLKVSLKYRPKKAI